MNLQSTPLPAEQNMTMETTAPNVGGTMNDTAERDVFELDDLEVHYGSFRAVREVTMKVRQHEITSFIGPSGCGKTTVLRCLNRMNDVIPSARVGGKVWYHGVDLYAPEISAAEVRRHVGMVFQKPNPFPKSIFDNVAYGPRISGIKKRGELDEIVERSLRGAALWDEVKDRLGSSALSLSGGQQQRVAIARALTQNPQVLLADEPVASLDPATCHVVMDYLKKVNQELGITVICNLHFLSLVRQYATRVIALKGGELVYEGSPMNIDEAWFEKIYGAGAKEVHIN